jgi:hypothetical protein
MRQAKTKMTVTDIQTNPGHTNEKGIYIEGYVIIAVKVEYGKKYSWNKAYRILQKEIDQFSLDEFKERIYKESRKWIIEKNLEADVMKKLKGTKNETVLLD